MAIFMRSAAVPCTGALMAMRSAAFRRLTLLDDTPGTWMRRPQSVSTYPLILAW
eukprot:CAMPEP_0170185268 /NCGR_PEP_ID=MMETSP0040_2-20121228/36154_1 /TAXON_ID=641309 /ORGANISM="Lotharella oceanica, Strain CCMP622" /LENGTH=53 /DNA_ID=CAMNT_0010431621 /DNA_START=278 /DNA_END=439 /DNA_ORIENTATION=+